VITATNRTNLAPLNSIYAGTVIAFAHLVTLSVSVDLSLELPSSFGLSVTLKTLPYLLQGSISSGKLIPYSITLVDNRTQIELPLRHIVSDDKDRKGY